MFVAIACHSCMFGGVECCGEVPFSHQCVCTSIGLCFLGGHVLTRFKRARDFLARPYNDIAELSMNADLRSHSRTTS